MNPELHGAVIAGRTRYCVVEVLVNDISVGLCGLGAHRKLQVPVNEYLTDGVNELCMIVNPGDAPATARDQSTSSLPASGAQPPMTPALAAFLAAAEAPSSDSDPVDSGWEPALDAWPQVAGAPVDRRARATVILSRYPVGATVGETAGEPLIRLDWTVGTAYESFRRQSQPFPFEMRKRQDIGPLFGRSAWLDCDPLILDARTEAEAREFVLTIIRSMKRGNADAVLMLSERKYRDLAAAYAISAAERAQQFHRMVTEETRKGSWMFLTPEDDEISFRLCAHGRMIECVGPDWEPIVRTAPGDSGQYMLPLFIGKLGGQWRILR